MKETLLTACHAPIGTLGRCEPLWGEALQSLLQLDAKD